MKLHFIFYGLILSSIVLLSCNKTTLVGSGLLTDEGINLVHTDTFSIVSRTIQQDSIITNSNTFKMSTLLCGQLDDPIFGLSTVEAYMDVHIGTLAPQLYYTDSMDVTHLAELDSIVLVLSFDPDATYGYEVAKQDVIVYPMEEVIMEDDTVYSNETFAFDENTILGSKTNYRISDQDTATIYEGNISGIDTLQVIGQLRIPLSTEFGEMLIQDSSILKNDSLFTDKYKGFKIISQPNGSSMMGWDMFNSGSGQNNRVIIYYKLGETARNYHFPIGGDWHANMVHDYDGTEIPNAIGDFEVGKEELYVQAMSGLDMELTFPSLSAENIGDVLINKAELELTVLELPEDDLDIYKPIGQFVSSVYNDELTKTLSLDAATALNFSSLSTMFGGVPFLEEDQGVQVRKYKINVTGHVIKMLNDEDFDSRLILSRYLKQERPDRAIICGSEHPMFPLKLNIVYSTGN